MRAIIRTRYGSPDVLQLRELEKPTPKASELLVQVHAASASAADIDQLRGVPFIRMAGPFRPAFKILGSDIAGRVEAVGSDVQRFQPGDEVFGDLSASGFGAFAEYVCAPEGALAPKPAGISFEAAAAVPESGVLALQGLSDRRQVQPGDAVLINGAGGGVGTFAVQLAKHFGAEVTGVDSAAKLDMLRSLGADHVIDYGREDYTESGRQVDLIIDCVANLPLSAYVRALRPKGAFIAVGGSVRSILRIALLGSRIAEREGKSIGLLMWKPNKREDVEYLTELLEAGQLVPVIDRCYPLSETAEALRRLEEGGAQGKVVITMEHDAHGGD